MPGATETASGTGPESTAETAAQTTHASLHAAILQVRGDYAARGMSLYDIGNGACFDFAYDVLDLVFGEDWQFHEGRHGWRTLASEDFYLPLEGCECTIGAVVWDWNLLATHWGIVVPTSDRAHHDAIVIRDPSHCWIFFDGRHYDCEHPDGVASFFDLSFFRRWLAAPSPDA